MGRRMGLLSCVLAALAALVVPSAASAAPVDGPTGWATAGDGTTGGTGAPADSVYVVDSRAELKAALDNRGDPNGRKIIKVRGAIHGNETDDGRLLGPQDYAPGWSLQRYMACFGPNHDEWSDDWHPWCDETGRLRTTGSNNEKEQIQIEVPSNTTLLGVGKDAKLLGVYLSIRSAKNIIIRNLHLESPVDYFSAWDPGDDGGSWNARFDALSIVTGYNIWIDHCTFTDGRFQNGSAPEGFHGEPVEQHDGLLDIEDGADFITVSANAFRDHEKSVLIGSGDSHADSDRGHLKVTFRSNLFVNSSQRSPRVRFGQVHVFNNYYVGNVSDPDYPMRSESMGGSSYFLGAGLESKMLSEYNVFDYTGQGATSDILVANFYGYQFYDRNSWFNGRPADANAVAKRKFEQQRAEAVQESEQNGTPLPEWATHEFTTDVGWNPADVYKYTPLTSEERIRSRVLETAGAGKLPIPADQGSR